MSVPISHMALFSLENQLPLSSSAGYATRPGLFGGYGCGLPTLLPTDQAGWVMVDGTAQGRDVE